MGVVLLLERLLITDFERSIKTEDFGNGSKQTSNDRGVVFLFLFGLAFPSHVHSFNVVLASAQLQGGRVVVHGAARARKTSMYIRLPFATWMEIVSTGEMSAWK